MFLSAGLMYELCVERYCYTRVLHVLTHSFPTRHSAELTGWKRQRFTACNASRSKTRGGSALTTRALDTVPSTSTVNRSEEHTSELQSLMRTSYAVFCLKKQKQLNNRNNYKNTNTKVTKLQKLKTSNLTHQH